jgi:Fur family ferric uptake transcriptional regulator
MASGTSGSMAEFRALITRSGLKYTRQREVVGQVFFGSDGHLSLAELFDLAKRVMPGIGYATVYRTMRVLVDGGLANEHHFGEGHTRFEVAHEVDHHDHLVCDRCGRIVEFEDEVIEARQVAIAAAHGFRMRSHRLEIHGECQSCVAEQGGGVASARQGV